MKLKEYLDVLNKLIEEDESILNLECYYVKDDEGNGGDLVYTKPDVGYIDDDMCPVHEDDVDDSHKRVVYVN
mgnify:FL=1